MKMQDYMLDMNEICQHRAKAVPITRNLQFRLLLCADVGMLIIKKPSHTIVLRTYLYEEIHNRIIMDLRLSKYTCS